MSVNLRVMFFAVFLLFISAIVVIFFRYDTYCEKQCVSYDRITGKWIKPITEASNEYEKIERKYRESQIKELTSALEALKGRTLNLEKARLSGMSSFEILDTLREEYNKTLKEKNKQI